MFCIILLTGPFLLFFDMLILYTVCNLIYTADNFPFTAAKHLIIIKFFGLKLSSTKITLEELASFAVHKDFKLTVIILKILRSQLSHFKNFAKTNMTRNKPNWNVANKSVEWARIISSIHTGKSATSLKVSVVLKF